MTFTQFQFTWNGWTGAPGVSLFRVSGDLDSTQTDAAAAAIRSLFSSIAVMIPSVVKISCEPLMRVVADGDGSLVHSETIATVPSDVNGSASGAFASLSGAAVIWRTTHSMGRRLLSGRTFMVPLGQSAFATDGRLASGFRTAISAGASTYVNRVAAGVPGHPIVWHRPSFKGATDGSSWPVSSGGVGLYPAELTARRT
jgi:hypothetical protein